MIVRICSFIGIVLVVALARLIPHPTNFTPLLAVALFCGGYAPARWMAYAIPVVAFWLSNMLLGYDDLGLVVACSLILIVAIGEVTKKIATGGSRTGKIAVWAGSGLVASATFFLITNFEVWKMTNMYPHTSEGLKTCFLMAIPFFQNQVLSTWLFTAAFFALWVAVAPVLSPALKKSTD